MSYLESAHEGIVHLVAEKGVTQVVVACPAPQVLVVAVVLGVLQDDNRGDPDAHADDEPATGK